MDSGEMGHIQKNDCFRVSLFRFMNKNINKKKHSIEFI